MTPQPVIAEHDVTVYLGDVRDVLAALPAGSVQCCVTSPPYYGLRDYGVDGQIGLEASPAEYVETMRGVFADVRRVLADDGVLWLNLGDSYATRANASAGPTRTRSRVSVIPPRRNTAAFARRKSLLMMPERVAMTLMDDGWILRNKIVWHKTNAMPESATDRLSSRWEHLFMLTKSERYWFDLDAIRELQDTAGRRHNGRSGYREDHPSKGGISSRELHPLGRNPGDVWAIPFTPLAAAHFATFPIALPNRCIAASCPVDGVVLDPFAGSGSTLAAARARGRKSIGIELNPAYIDIIRDRIGQTPLDFGEAS